MSLPALYSFGTIWVRSRHNSEINPLIFGISLICTGLFVGGTWLLVKALGTAMSGKNPVQVALLFVVGLGLKFPAVVFCLKVIKMKPGPDWNGAIAGIILAYSIAVTIAALSKSP